MKAENSITTSDEDRSVRIRQRIELLSAVLLAAATIATAWSAYQSARWGGQQTGHETRALTAIVRTGKYANLAEQKIGVHADLFGQWAAAVSTENRALADFFLARFPEPLDKATEAWLATEPLSNPDAPATPFSMPEYVLKENAEAERWEAIAIAESEASDRAGEISDRYLVFTIIFAAVLFFGGISGKFNWQIIDITVLAFGALALIGGIGILLWTPIL